MEGKILGEFDIEEPRLVYELASREFILKNKGKAAWDKVYKRLCNEIRDGCNLGNKALCLSTMSSKEDGMICFSSLHVTVLDYDIGYDESFFIKANRDDNKYTISDKDLDEELIAGDDNKMNKVIKTLQPIRQTKIVNPYIVQMLLSEPYIIAKNGEFAWSEKYVKTCLDVQSKLGEEDVVEWNNGMIVIGVVCDDDGIVDYKHVLVCQFDQDLKSHMTYNINQDGQGKMELTLLANDEEGTIDV